MKRWNRCFITPASQILDQVQHGDRLVRAAALATAADRFEEDQTADDHGVCSW
ncbi:MAG: hypothetical protein R3C02_06370 [Planctomycetaceae bacterium]